jgi:hypothetical protein
VKKKEPTKDKKIKGKPKYPFSRKETWFVEKIVYKKNMILEIELVGSKIGTPEKIRFQSIDLGIGTPVLRDTSKHVLLRFYQPLAFQRLDESFAMEKGKFSGDVLRKYSESEYLKYYSKVKFYSRDEPILHYCLVCSDDIINILTNDEPEIEILN